ncbi:hypothetical protein ACWD48_14490 [Streptomyces sp. NPDC002519]
MPEPVPDQLPFTVEFREDTSEVVVWMTFGAGPNQTMRRKAFASLEQLVIAVTEHRHEAMLQSLLAQRLTDAAIKYLGADPARLETAVRALSDPASTVPLGTLLYDTPPGRGGQHR